MLKARPGEARLGVRRMSSIWRLVQASGLASWLMAVSSMVSLTWLVQPAGWRLIRNLKRLIKEQAVLKLRPVAALFIKNQRNLSGSSPNFLPGVTHARPWQLKTRLKFCVKQRGPARRKRLRWSVRFKSIWPWE